MGSFCAASQERGLCMGPLRAESHSHSPVGLLGVSPTGFQSQKFWGLISPVQVPRVGGPDVGLELFTPRGNDLLSVRPLLLTDHCAGGEVFGKTVSPSHLDVPFYPLVEELFS